MRRKINRVIVLIIFCAFLLNDWNGAKENQIPINVGITDDIVSLDVAGTKDILSETIGRCVFSTLYAFDENMELVPSLAKSAEQLSDFEWIFTIRDDVKFHDGTPLTAADVVFSIQRAMTIEKAEQALLLIEKIEAASNDTFHITTKDPVANLPSLFVRTSTAIMSEKAMSDPDYDVEQPVGSGPFKVLERVPGMKIRLERFDDYFDGPAKTKYLNFVVESSEPTSTASLLNGNIDVLYRIAANDGEYLKLNEQVTIYQMDSTKTELLIFNPKVKPMDDIRIRQAIAYAIDKQNIVDKVLSGFARTQSSMIPAPLIGFADFDGYDYDVEKAVALMTEAGYPDGFDLTVLTFDSQRKKLMEYLKMGLAEANINLNYEFLELADYLDGIAEGTQMGSVMSWTSNADPDSTFTQLYSSAGHPTVNQSGYSDPRVEELLQQGRMETDLQKRDEIYREANEIIASSYVAIPLYQPAVLVAARKDIEGVRVNSQGIFGYESLYRTEDR